MPSHIGLRLVFAVLGEYHSDLEQEPAAVEKIP